MTDCTISNNTGRGIFNQLGTVTLRNCTVSGNTNPPCSSLGGLGRHR